MRVAVEKHPSLVRPPRGRAHPPVHPHYSQAELCLTGCYKGLLVRVWEGRALQLAIKTAIKVQYV